MNEIVRWYVSTGMRPTDSDERIRVRVNYVPRGYGLALTISEDSGAETAPPDEVGAADEAVAFTTEPPSCIQLDAESEVDAAGTADDGYLTVVESGVTTLELRRADGESSYLIWDQAEVDWASLQAG